MTDSPSILASPSCEVAVQPPDAQIHGKARVEDKLAILKILRPKQWTKNLIAFAPLIFAAKAHDPQLLLYATLCVLSFCLLSSAIYIVNDVMDRSFDRLHPVKSKRPISSGAVSVPLALTIAALLLPASFLIAYYVRPALLIVLLAYMLIGAAYSLKLKQIPIIDVFIIAGGFLLRAVAGAVAVHVPMSSWFLLCTGLGALFLALEKRRNELTSLDSSTEHRAALAGYSVELLDRFEGLVLPSLLTAYVFYSFQSIHGQWMMLTVPFVVYGLMRYQQISSRDGSTGAPEEILFKDRAIQLTLFFWLATAALVVYGKIPELLNYVVTAIDSLR